MEIPKNHSIRDASWHPRSIMPRPLTESEQDHIMTFLEKQKTTDHQNSRPEPMLDPKTKAEVETGIIAHFPGERMEKLFDQEFDQEFEEDKVKKVRKEDYLSRSLRRKIVDLFNS